MRVSERFAVVILIVAVGMSAMSLGTTDPVAAQGSKRYVLLGAGNTLPAGLEAIVAAAGGTVVQRIDEIGVAIVESSEPSFVVAAEGIFGVQGVAEDLSVEIAPAEESAVTVEDAGAEAIVAEGAVDPTKAEFFSRQWNLQAIGADKTLGMGSRGDPRVRVAIVDTGIDYTNKELAGKVDMLASASFFTEVLPVAGLKAFADVNGHGTHVAGIIAASGYRVAGIAPNVTLIAVKVGGRDGFASWAAIAAGIVHAANMGADVINTSFGAAFEKGGRDAAQLMAAMNRAVNYAHAKGSLIVASAGNGSIDWDSRICEETLPDGTTKFVNCPAGKLPSNMTLLNMMKLPAQLPHVLAVSATGPAFFDGFDNFADYSDYGQSIINFAAPGGSCIFRVNCDDASRIDPDRQHDAIRSACSSFLYVVVMTKMGPMKMFPCGINSRTPKNTVERRWGTSMAAAHASGVAALVDSAFGGALRGEGIMAILKRSADDLGKPGKDEQYGFGRINAYRAVTRK